jgi:hypothetical protein
MDRLPTRYRWVRLYIMLRLNSKSMMLIGILRIRFSVCLGRFLLSLILLIRMIKGIYLCLLYRNLSSKLIKLFCWNKSLKYLLNMGSNRAMLLIICKFCN